MPFICLAQILNILRRERGFYLSLLGGVWAIASSIGPIVGGAFSQYVTWRWIFWINREYRDLLDGLMTDAA